MRPVPMKQLAEELGVPTHICAFLIRQENNPAIHFLSDGQTILNYDLLEKELKVAGHSLVSELSQKYDSTLKV